MTWTTLRRGTSVVRRPLISSWAHDGGAAGKALNVRHFGKKQGKSVDKKQVAKMKLEGEMSSKHNMVVACLDAPEDKEPPITEEEKERRHKVGRNYVIGKFERHNEMAHDLTCKIRLKNHAIKMLPKNSDLKAAALEIDEEGPPRWRRMPAWTPPIPGFNAEEFLSQNKV